MEKSGLHFLHLPLLTKHTWKMPGKPKWKMGHEGREEEEGAPEGRKEWDRVLASGSPRLKAGCRPVPWKPFSQ